MIERPLNTEHSHNPPQRKVVIIGNGVSGITAARHIRKMSDDRIQVISDETDHFFARTALMYVYMGHMRYEDIKPYEDFFWDKNRIERVRGWVKRIDTEKKRLYLADEKELRYDVLILALGSSYNLIGWEGQDLDGVQGLYSWQDLELMENNTQNAERAVVVGGGLIGVEMAEMLRTRNIEVDLLVREDRYWGSILPPEEGEMVSRHAQEHEVRIHHRSELERIEGGGDGKVAAVHTKDGQRLPADFVGITIGVHPKIELLENTSIETQKGVMVDRHFRTNVPDVYAVGDCAQFKDPPEGRGAIEQVWYTGKMHGEVVAHNICGNEVAYEPGPWFNSAKFFDIEYQTYGRVPPEPEATEGVGTFYWEHEEGRKAFRVTWDEASGSVIGFNLMGIRVRHELCERWIKEGRHVDEVMRALHRANFDPEFTPRHDKQILHAYNLRFGKDLRPLKEPSLLQRIFGKEKLTD